MPTYILRPNGDDKADWTETPVGTAFSILDEPYDYGDASAGLTTYKGSNYIASNTDSQTCRLNVETTTLAAGEVPVMARAVIHARAAAGRLISFGVVGGSSSSNLFSNTSYGWLKNLTPTTGIADQSAVDGLQLNIVAVAGTGEVRVAIAYIELQTSFGGASARLLTGAG